MSTRARIGIHLQDGTVRSIGIGRDGNPRCAGKTLKNVYNTEEKILELMEKGDILDLEKTPDECTLQPLGKPAQISKLSFYINSQGYDFIYIFTRQQGWQYLDCNE